MQTGEAVRMQTQALMKEAEELSAESRQQRTRLACINAELLKLHARLQPHGLGSDKLPQLLAAHGLLPSPLPLLRAEHQGSPRQRAQSGPDQASTAWTSLPVEVSEV
jgi:hypothetical protein